MSSGRSTWAHSVVWSNAKSFLVSPERVFLLFSISLGILLVFLLPPFQAPDEQVHFFKAYKLSNFEVVPKKFIKDGEVRYGGTTPVETADTVSRILIGKVPGQPTIKYDSSLFVRYIGQRIDTNKTIDVAFEGAALYSPIAYIPQAIGIAMGNLFQLSPLVLMWLGRLTNLAVWICLVYLAIKKLPFAKWGMVVLLLNPMALFLAASLSADAAIMGLACLFVSLTIVAATQKEPLSKKAILILIVLLAALTLTKPVYLIFGMAFLAIPYKNIGNMKLYSTFIASAASISMALAVLWNLVIVKDVINATGALQKPESGISPSGQIGYIVNHVPAFVTDLVQNYILVTPGFYGSEVLSTYFGVFGWLDSRLPLWTVILYIIALTIAVLYQFGRGVSMELWQKVIFVATVGGLSVATVTALYLNYTPVGQAVVEGVQGRYFIPISVLLLALFLGKKKLLMVSDKGMGIFIATSLAIVYLMTIATLYYRYYW